VGSKGSQTSTSTYKPPKEVMDNYRYVTDLAKQVAATPYERYKGELVAGMTPTQMAGIQNVNQAQGMALPYYQEATSLASDAATAGDTRNFKQSDIDTYMSPYLNNVVGSTMANLEEQNKRQRQDLVGTAISRGAFGGDRGKIAEAELNRQQGLSTGKTLSDLLQGGYSQALGQFNQGIANKFTGAGQIAGYGTGAQQSVLQGAQAQMAAGAQQQAVRQAQDTANYQQFQQQQAYPFQTSQYLANITQGIGAQSGGTSTQTQPGPSMGGQVLGFATAMAGMPWSDIRLKENVGVIGKTFDGQPIYKYNLKGQEQTQIGLMAQDVEKRNPDAVHQYKGFKKVDYDAATHDAEKRGHFAFGGVVPRYADGGSINDIIQSLQDYQEPGATPLPYGQYGAPYGSNKSPIFPKEALKGLGGMGRGQTPAGAEENYIPRAPRIQEQESPVDALKKGLQAMSPAQTANLKSNMGSLGLGSKGKTLYTAPIGPSSTGDPMQAGLVSKKDESVLEHGLNYLFPSLFKNHGGGVVGRNHYEDGGAPTYKVQPQNVEDMPQYQQALLQAIYGPESGGRYDIMQGGKETFDTSGPHPNRVAQGGESTAAGAGQFINSTWNDVTGGAPMTKPYQDAATLALAKRDFNRRTGQDLDTVLQEQGVTPDVLKALSPTWVALANKPASGAVAAGDMSRGPGLVPPDGEAQPSSLLERVTGMKLSEEARSGLLAAGLGMMASRSPFMGVAIGEGGLGGLQTYYNALANKRAGEKQQAETEVAKRTVAVSEAGVPIERQRVDIDQKAKNLEAYKFWIASFVPVPQKDGSILYRDQSGQLIDEKTYRERISSALNSLGLAPFEVSTPKSNTSTTAADSALGGVNKPTTEAPTAGGVVPSAVEPPKEVVQSAPKFVREEDLLNPPLAAAKVGTQTENVPVNTPNEKMVIDADNPTILDRLANEQMKIMKTYEDRGLTAPPSAKTLYDSYVARRTAILEGKQPVEFKDGTAGIYPAVKEAKLAETAETEAAKALRGQGDKILAEANASRSAAYSMQMRLDGMRESIKQLPEEGWLSLGYMAPERLEVAKGINFFGAFLKDFTGREIYAPIDPQALGAAEDVFKNTFKLATDMAQQLGREPGFILERIQQANPGIENSKMGYDRIAAGMQATAQYAIEKANFQEKWYDDHKGNMSGSETAFHEANPPEKYIRLAIVSTIPPEKVEKFVNYATKFKGYDLSKAKTIFDKEYGKGVSDIVLGK